MNNTNIKLSIKDLIEYTMRAGDLSSGFVGASRAVVGTKAHQQVQKQLKQDFQESKAPDDVAELLIELPFNHTFEYQGFSISIEGRIDAVKEHEALPELYEIKSTYNELDSIMSESDSPHWAQAICYAYIYCTLYNKQKALVNLIYFQLDSEKTRVLSREYDFKALEVYFMRLLEKYIAWCSMSREWRLKRDSSIKELDFPFNEYRKGQREFVVAVYKTIREGKRLYIQAPTGTGKTISVLFPAIKALGEGHTEKLFYLTARTTHKQIALDTVKDMQKKGMALKCLVITAKEKICPKDQVICDPDYCEYAQGYYDRIDKAVMDIFKNEMVFDRGAIDEYSKRYLVCPFEYSLDISLWVDCIICDYNYVFDPRVYLKRFFADRKKGEHLLLVDEAHNMVDRARDMYSAELSKREILGLKKSLRLSGEKSPLMKLLNGINSAMLSYKKLCGQQKNYCQLEPFVELNGLVRDFAAIAEQWLPLNRASQSYEHMLDLYFKANMFIKISELYDEKYYTYVDIIDGDTVVKQFCVDPSYRLQEVLNRIKSGVFFSATLSPMSYYKELLGGYKEDYAMKLPYPFEKSNLQVYIAGNVSTKFKNRQYSFGIIAEYIYTCSSIRKGNYMVFFPSYKYMSEVYQVFSERYPEVRIVQQDGSMDEAQREDFIAGFLPGVEESYVAFTVLGSFFSEGIDLVGDRLLGAIIIGVGLPQLCLERDIIMQYFDKTKNSGYNYSYIFPGMNKVLQAAGRVIRSKADKGIIVLIDERYKQGTYKHLMPEEWNPNKQVNSTGELAHELESFWGVTN